MQDGMRICQHISSDDVLPMYSNSSSHIIRTEAIINARLTLILNLRLRALLLSFWLANTFTLCRL
jgi:hypothetical protein